MPDVPPAIIVPASDIADAFRLESLDDISAVTGRLVLVPRDCRPSQDGEIVVCGTRGKVPDHRLVSRILPLPVEEVAEPLVIKSGPLEFGLGRKGLGLRLRF